jgi:ABC-type oligopeptide transport system substrate-binding subunit
MVTRRLTCFLPTVLLACVWLASPVSAKTLSFASAFDPNSLDPHSLALLYHSRVVTQIYEGLVIDRTSTRCNGRTMCSNCDGSELTRWRIG